MARPSNLASMSVDALIKLRDDIGSALSRKAEGLKKELAALGADYAEFGRIAIYGKKSVRGSAGRKVAPKYRDRAGNTWAGRGAQPVWMTEAIKKGAKREDFLIDKSRVAAARKGAAVKRGRRKKK